jgi:S-adenosylmethionine decarboxylase proenzyme
MKCVGTHILVDCYGCQNKDLLENAKELEKVIVSVAEKYGATILNSFSHKFEPQGVTVNITISESHIALHTYPEHQWLITLDVYTCGNVNTELIVDELSDIFQAETSMITILNRGLL